MKSLSLFLAFGVGLAPLVAQTLFVPNGQLGTSSNGNVGIGTSSPTAFLSVYGTDPQKPVLLIDRPYDGARTQFRYYNEATAGEIGMTWYGSGRIAVWSGANLDSTGSSHMSAPKQAVTTHPSWLTLLDTFSDSFDVLRIPPGGAATSYIKITGSGNVGIGTATPTSFGAGAVLTEVHGTTSYGALLTSTNNVTGQMYANEGGAAVHVGSRSNHPLLLTVGNVERMVVSTAGNVGIGTFSPSSKLEVKGPSTWQGTIRVNSGAGQYSSYGWMIGDTLQWSAYAHPGTTPAGGLIFANGAGSDSVTFSQNGNVGIGTTHPTHKLAVNGAIRAKEVIVDTGWADYVFADDYKLKPLSEVEAHIKEKKHLPGIPSAEEVAENGVSIGEMQARLLAKVEELTLHLIDLKKENVQLRQEVNELKAVLTD